MAVWSKHGCATVRQPGMFIPKLLTQSGFNTSSNDHRPVSHAQS